MGERLYTAKKQDAEVESAPPVGNRRPTSMRGPGPEGKYKSWRQALLERETLTRAEVLELLDLSPPNLAPSVAA